ncbi:hypothetical protein [Sulfurovum sp.]|uniref:hypothetical protein n=1 Tax=Sulfurovum sp. TaxID=1969726 RepID=UPI0035653314
MYKKLKYISSVLAVVAMIFFIVFYLKIVDRKSLYHDKHFITIFTEEIGLGPNSHRETYIVPKYKFLLAFIGSYDHIKIIDSDSKLIAIKNDELKIFIPPNKVIIHHNDISYEVEENTITHLQDFSGFKNVIIYLGGSLDSRKSYYEIDKIKEQFLKDTKQYWIQEDS